VLLWSVDYWYECVCHICAHIIHLPRWRGPGCYEWKCSWMMLKTWAGTALLSSYRMKAAGFLAAAFIMWTCARTHRSCDERDLSKHSLALPQQSHMSNSMSTTVISITPMNCCIDRLLKLLLIVTEDFL